MSAAPTPRTFTKPSMKVPPKRKGNATALGTANLPAALNESPSEKEGKSEPARGGKSREKSPQ